MLKVRISKLMLGVNVGRNGSRLSNLIQAAAGSFPTAILFSVHRVGRIEIGRDEPDINDHRDGERAMEAQYEGHYINLSAVRLPKNKWRCLAVVHWDDGREGHLKLLRCDDREFYAEADAVRAAYEVAVRWINEGKPEPFTWTKDLR